MFYRNVADQLASPIAVRRKPNCSTSWFDAECHAKRRKCRMLERRYRRTRSVTDCRAWVDSTGSRLRLHRSNKEYWLSRLETCGRTSTKIWKTMSPFLRRTRIVTGATIHTADGFAVFFASKIERVRPDTAGLPPPPIINSVRSSFTSFQSCSPEEVRKTIMSSPIKSCSLDPVPAFILREFIGVLLPLVTQTCRQRVSSAGSAVRLTETRNCHAASIKKPDLDTADMNNYRMVSSRYFMSKEIGRVVANQLYEYLSANDLLPRFQSAYRKGHSTETSLLRVWSVMLMAADEEWSHHSGCLTCRRRSTASTT